jgi:hypothetical protein
VSSAHATQMVCSVLLHVITMVLQGRVDAALLVMAFNMPLLCSVGCAYYADCWSGCVVCAGGFRFKPPMPCFASSLLRIIVAASLLRHAVMCFACCHAWDLDSRYHTYVPGAANIYYHSMYRLQGYNNLSEVVQAALFCFMSVKIIMLSMVAHVWFTSCMLVADIRILFVRVSHDY